MTKSLKSGKSDSGSSPAPKTNPPGNGLETTRQSQADLLEEESPSPSVCLKHPRAVYFDGPTCCPACSAEREFLKLTSGKFSNPRIRG